MVIIWWSIRHFKRGLSDGIYVNDYVLMKGEERSGYLWNGQLNCLKVNQLNQICGWLLEKL